MRTLSAQTGVARSFIWDANGDRRHLSPGQQAAGRALMLIAQGKRKDGRWQRGAIHGSVSSDAERNDLARCGLVADWTDLLPQVLAGTVALDAAYATAQQIKATEQGNPETRCVPTGYASHGV